MADTTGLIHATIVSITAEYSPDRPFEAMAQSRLGPLRVFLEERPLTEIKVGDELIFRPVQVRSNANDGVLEVMPNRDALSSALTALTQDEVTVYRSDNVNPRPTISFGAADALKWAKEKSMAATLTRKTGVTIVSRPDASTHGDHVVKWVTRRFGEASLAHLKNVADVIIQPGAISAARSEFRINQYRNNPHEAIAAALLPDYLQHAEPDGSDPLIDIAVGNRPYYVGPRDVGQRDNVGIIYPYSLTDTGIANATRLSAWRPAGALPKLLIGARSRFMLTSAHEMSHSLHLDFRAMLPKEKQSSEMALFQVREAFADALALMIFITETKCVDDAKRYADLRAIAAIGSSISSHTTGRACHAAINAACDPALLGSLRHIETIELVKHATNIAIDNIAAPEQDYALLRRALSERDPVWSLRSGPEIAAAVSETTRLLGGHFHEPRTMMADVRAAIAGLNNSFITGLVNKPEAYRDHLRHIASLDMEDHTQECLFTTGRAATAEALDVIEAAHSASLKKFTATTFAQTGGADSNGDRPLHEILNARGRDYHQIIADAARNVSAQYRYRLSTQMTGARQPLYVATRRVGPPVAADQTTVGLF